MINNILAYLKGSVEIEAEGRFIERFLNICMRREIFLSDVKRQNERRISARIGIEGFRQIRPIARKTKTRVRIKRKSGMPFLLHRYKSRKALIAGVAVFFAVLWYLSGHIVGIDISGNSRVSKDRIEAELKSFGVYRGASVSQIEEKSVQNLMMTRIDELAWIGVNIKGSRVFVEVKERLDTKQNFDADIPCNIVALRDGRISGLEVASGQTTVKIGEFVEKGDLLVSGVMDSKVVGLRYEHSAGKVFAETLYKKTGKYPLEFTEKRFTGNEKTRRSITVFGKKIPLYINDRPPFENSDRTLTRESFYFFSDKIFNVDTERETYKEYIPQKVSRTVEEAVSFGSEKLLAELEKEIPQAAEILTRNVSYKELEDGQVEVTAEILCNEDIAMQSLIDKTEVLDYN